MENIVNTVVKAINSQFGGCYIKYLNVEKIQPGSLFLEAEYLGQKVLLLVSDKEVAKALIATIIYVQDGINFQIHEDISLKELSSFVRIFDLMSLKHIFKDNNALTSNILKRCFFKGIANFHSEGLSSYLEENIKGFTFKIVDPDIVQSQQLYTLSIFNDNDVAAYYHFSSLKVCSMFAEMINMYCLHNDHFTVFNISNSFLLITEEPVMIISL